MKRRRRCGSVRLLFLAAAIGAFAFDLARPLDGVAWTRPTGIRKDTDYPVIPDAADVRLSREEWARVRGGEIVVGIITEEDKHRHVQAVGYLDAHPVWLFDLATDSAVTTELVDIMKRVDVIEAEETGKVIRGVVDVSALLPTFQYTLAVAYLEDRTGQCWSQIEGDFRRNEGTHSYLWDFERGKTLGVFTFDLGLKGVLSIVPDGLVLKLTGRTLPGYMRAIDALAKRLAREDPERALRIGSQWLELRARLQRGELPGRVWREGPEIHAAPARPESGAPAAR